MLGNGSGRKTHAATNIVAVKCYIVCSINATSLVIQPKHLRIMIPGTREHD